MQSSASQLLAIFGDMTLLGFFLCLLLKLDMSVNSFAILSTLAVETDSILRQDTLPSGFPLEEREISPSLPHESLSTISAAGRNSLDVTADFRRPEVDVRCRERALPRKSSRKSIRPIKPPRWKEPAPTVFIRDAGATHAAVNVLRKHSRIAVDCEGVLLSRTGALCLVQIASPECVFMFDIAFGKHDLFDAGLRELLESSTVCKVMHDCRHDCDALLHQYSVLVAPVVDTQVAFFVLRDVRGLKVGLPVSLKTLLKKFVRVREEDIVVKEDVKASMKENSKFWLKRPLSVDALRYARFDVMYLLHVAKILQMYITDIEPKGWNRVLRESKAYSALFRDDDDGPRKAEIQWARMVTEANADMADRDRSKMTAKLRETDPMRHFKFSSGDVLNTLRDIESTVAK